MLCFWQTAICALFNLTTYHAKCKVCIMHESETFSAFVRYSRLSKGYRQGDCARLLGVSARTISQWERDKQRPFPYAEKAIRLALASAPPLSAPCDDRGIRRRVRRRGVAAVDQRSSQSPSRMPHLETCPGHLSFGGSPSTSVSAPPTTVSARSQD